MSGIIGDASNHRPGAWYGPDTTSNAGRLPMSGAEFNATRDKANAERAGVNTETGAVKTPFAIIAHNLGPVAGITKEGAEALARYLTGIMERCDKLEAQVQELQNQMTLVRGLPPFMAKAEHRG
jgi:hypothetical protein